MDQPLMPPMPRDPSPLWRNLSFTLMWTSTAASGFGDRMMMLVALALLGALAANATDASGIQASTQFWFFLPYLLVSVPAGWLADRVPRKWVLLGCDECRGVLMLTGYFLLAGATGPAAIDGAYHWRVYAILAAIGTFAATFGPARNAIVPQIVPAGQLQPANAVILGINVIASLVGMTLGARIIRADDVESVRAGLFIGAMFYMVSGTFFAFMRTHSRRADAARVVVESSPGAQAARFIFAHRRILSLIGLQVLIWSSAALVSTGMLGLGRIHHHLVGDPLNYFFTSISATLGAGMLIGAIFIGAMGIRRESPLVMFLGVAVTGVCVTVLAVVPSRWVAFPAAFCVGFFGNIVIVTATTLLQSLSPNYIRGRVMGVNSMVNTAFAVLTYYAIWRLPDTDRNIVIAMIALGVLLALVGVYSALRYVCTGPLQSSFVNALWHINRLYALVWHRLRWVGRYHVPHTGPVILAANHTTGIDPFVIQCAVPRLIRWLMVADYMFAFANPLWRAVKPIALDKAAGDLNKIRLLVATLKEGHIVGLFPEGSLQRTQRDLQPFRAGIAMIARRADARIVPVWIHGTPCKHHMLWHFLTPSRTTVIFGPPFDPPADMPDDQVVTELRDRMVALARQVEAD